MSKKHSKNFPKPSASKQKDLCVCNKRIKHTWHSPQVVNNEVFSN